MRDARDHRSTPTRITMAVADRAAGRGGRAHLRGEASRSPRSAALWRISRFTMQAEGVIRSRRNSGWSGVNPVPQTEFHIGAAAGPLALRIQPPGADAGAPGASARPGRHAASRSGLVRVDDGVRQIYVPHVRSRHPLRDGINAAARAVAAEICRRHRLRAARGRRRRRCRRRDRRVHAVVRRGGRAGRRRSSRIRSPSPAWRGTPRRFAGVQIFPYALWKERANLRLHGSFDTAESSLIEDGKANSRNVDVEAWPLDRLPFMVAPAGHRLDEDRRRGRGAGDPRRRHRARCDGPASSRSTSARRTGGRTCKARVEASLDCAEFPPHSARPQRHDPGAEHVRWSGPINNRVLGSTQFLSGSPRSNASICRAICAASAFASETAATCGVIVTFSNVPERAVGRERLLLEHVEARAGQRAVARAPSTMSASTWRAAATGIDEDRDRRAARSGAAVSTEPEVDEAPRLRRERQQRNQDVGAGEKRVETALRRRNVSTPGDRSSVVRDQPRTGKPRRRRASAALAPITPSPMMPTVTCLRARMLELAPDMLCAAGAR